MTLRGPFMFKPPHHHSFHTLFFICSYLFTSAFLGMLSPYILPVCVHSCACLCVSHVPFPFYYIMNIPHFTITYCPGHIPVSFCPEYRRQLLRHSQGSHLLGCFWSPFPWSLLDAFIGHSGGGWGCLLPRSRIQGLWHSSMSYVQLWWLECP